MSKVYVSEEAAFPLKERLAAAGHEVVELSPLSGLEPALARHADVRMCSLGREVFHGEASRIGCGYPADCLYNACSTGKFFIHNLAYTAPELLAAAEALGQIFVNVSQGYAKCSCVVVDENSLITADRGIEKAASAAGMDALLISSAQVALAGYPYGFLGGASGLVGGELFFNGDLAAHSDFAAIKAFLKERGVRPVYFPGLPLTDIGSIIEEQ